MVDKILGFIESLAVAKLVDDEKDFITYGEEGALAADDWNHWEPELEADPESEPKDK
jgi:hypothetical protein